MEREHVSHAQTAVSGRAGEPGLDAYPVEFVRQSVRMFSGQEVCLFVTYVPGDRLLPGAVAMVQALAASGQTVVVCCAVDDPGLNIDLAGLDDAAWVVKRQNGGYDFAVWTAVLARMPELWSARRLFFVNDSILGPLDGFPRTLERIRASSADFLALTESFELRHHSQSYFFVLQNKGMSSDAMHAFWRDVRVEKTKAAVIENYELSLLQHARDVAGLGTEILFSYDFLFPGVDWSAIKIRNPTHSLWEHLINSGFPFVKAELLLANPQGISIGHWEPIVALHGGDVDLFRKHLTQMRETRGLPDRHRMFERSKFLRWILGEKRVLEIQEIWSATGRSKR